MRCFVDTNVIIDLLAKREEYLIPAQQLFSLADKNEVVLVVSSLSIANAYYVLNDNLKIKSAREIIGKLKAIIEVAALDDKIIELSLNEKGIKDFEDAIQYFTAVENQCELIVTRNIKDFKKSEIPVMSPEELLTKLSDS